MKKYILLICLLVVAIVVPIAFSGCSLLEGGNSTKTVNSIERISKTKSDGLEDIYTIYYTDGTTNQFVIKNGANGQNGENGKDGEVDIIALWQKYCEETGSSITFQEFIDNFLDFEAAQDNSKVINSCLLSAVKILCEINVQTTSGGAQTSELAVVRGSGIIYKINSDYTYIATNYHVMNYYPDSLGVGVTFDGASITKASCWLYGCGGAVDYNYQYIYSSGELITKITGIKAYDGYEIEMEYVGGSAEADIAIVKVPTSEVLSRNSQAKAVVTASDYYVGETAIAIGNPEDKGISATQGIISVHDEFVALSVGGTTSLHRSVRFDTSIYHGSSGGGLFNKNGELIGITNAGDNTDEHINWAVPVQIVEGVANSIISQDENGAETPIKAKKVVVGINVGSENQTYRYDSVSGYGKIEEDAVVRSVEENSIAIEIGFVAGDIIKAIVINGTQHKIYRYFDVGDWLHKVDVDDEISFLVVRNESEIATGTHTIVAEDLVSQK